MKSEERVEAETKEQTIKHYVKLAHLYHESMIFYRDLAYELLIQHRLIVEGKARNEKTFSRLMDKAERAFSFKKSMGAE